MERHQQATREKGGAQPLPKITAARPAPRPPGGGEDERAIYSLLRPLLFRLDPESAHHLALQLLAAAGRWGTASRLVHRWCRRRLYPHEAALVCRRWGLRFPGPVGLAAGFDKDAVAVVALAALGFHFIEVGTVTPRPQPGNPRPRLFREPEKAAL